MHVNKIIALEERNLLNNAHTTFRPNIHSLPIPTFVQITSFKILSVNLFKSIIIKKYITSELYIHYYLVLKYFQIPSEITSTIPLTTLIPV